MPLSPDELPSRLPDGVDFPRFFAPVLTLALAAFVLALASSNFVQAQQQETVGASPDVMPRYDAGRNLILPADYRRWILVGSSLGLSYSQNAQERGHETFNTTLMEPSAYQFFVTTGMFREGTMLALISQGVGINALPAKHGQFATDVHAIEMAVKDSKRVAEGWAYLPVRGANDGRLFKYRGASAQGELLRLSRPARGAGPCIHAVLWTSQ